MARPGLVPVLLSRRTAATVVSEAQAYWLASVKSGEYLPDLTGHGHDARFGSVGSARVINKGQAKYLRLNGVSGNYASAPDSAALDITGDITIDVRAALNDWTPAVIQTLAAKYTTSGNQRSYWISVATDGTLQFVWSPNGTTTTTIASTVATGLTDGTTKWVRVSFDVDNGALGNDVKFYLSDDGVSWTQLGTTVTTALTTSIFASTAILEVGSRNTGSNDLVQGRCYNARVYNSYLQASSGTPVFNADFTNLADGTTSFTESSSNAATVTINSTSGSDTNDPTWLEYTGTKCMYLPGTSGNVATTINTSFASKSTGTITMRAKIRFPDYTPSSPQNILGGTSTYLTLDLSTDGTLLVRVVDSSVVVHSVSSSAAIGTTDDTDVWVEAVINLDTDTATFRTATDTTNDHNQVTGWVVLGSANRIFNTPIPEVGSIQNNLAVGNRNHVGSSTSGIGRVYSAAWLNNGTVVADPNFSTQPIEPFASFTDGLSNSWNLTRSATGKKLAIVDRTMLLFGTDDYLEVADQDNLDFAASGSFTASVLTRVYGTTTNQVLLAKKNTIETATDAGYVVNRGATANTPRAYIADGTNGTADNATSAVSEGVLALSSAIRDVSADTITGARDGDSETGATDTTTASLSNAAVLRIGATSGTAANFLGGEVVGAAIFRKALTASQLAQVKSELGG